MRNSQRVMGKSSFASRELWGCVFGVSLRKPGGYDCRAVFRWSWKPALRVSYPCFKDAWRKEGKAQGKINKKVVLKAFWRPSLPLKGLHWWSWKPFQDHLKNRPAFGRSWGLWRYPLLGLPTTSLLKQMENAYFPEEVQEEEQYDFNREMRVVIPWGSTWAYSVFKIR